MKLVTDEAAHAALERDAARYRALREQVDRGQAIVAREDARGWRHHSDHTTHELAAFGHELDRLVDNMRPVDTRALATPEPRTGT